MISDAILPGESGDDEERVVEAVAVPGEPTTSYIPDATEGEKCSPSDPTVRVSPRAEDENWEAGYADAVSEVVEALDDLDPLTNRHWTGGDYADYIRGRFGPDPTDERFGSPATEEERDG